jgi:hypothetical protein
VSIDVEHVRPNSTGIRLMIPRSKTDASGAGAEIGIMSGADEVACPVRARRAWLKMAEIVAGPVFRRVTHAGTVRSKRLHPDAVRQILRRRAAAVGVKGTLMEPITPHGKRAGFVTTAYKNGAPDEEIMGHTRHRSRTTIRGYVRRAKLGKVSPSGKLGL